MAITDKTRKVLWGRSGNRCAICRQPLVVEQTDLAAEAVVGEECHIISAAANGPRHDPAFSQERIDDISNLLLLCRVHHKMVDDQYETYSAELLRSVRANHEKWVESKLKDDAEIPPVTLRRVKDEIPTHLLAVESGKYLFSLASGCHGSYQEYSDDLTEDEVEAVGGFFQNLQDWVDIGESLEPLDKVKAAKCIDDSIRELDEIGFMVFAGKEKQRLEGGIHPPSSFMVLHTSVFRKSDPRIISVNKGNTTDPRVRFDV